MMNASTNSNTLYSVFAMTDATGAITEGSSYDAYGKRTVYTGAGSDGVWFTNDDATAFSGTWALRNTIGLAGYRYDPETGNYYVNNRYYNSGLGRWLSRDPIGYAASDTNLYDYCNSNVTGALDPFGLDERICCAKVQANWVAQKFSSPAACATALFRAIAAAAVKAGGSIGSIGGGYLGLSGTAGKVATTAMASTGAGLITGGFVAGAVSAGIATYHDCEGLCNEENCLAPCSNRTMMPTFDSGWLPWGEIKCGTELACAKPCDWFVPHGPGR